VHGRVTGHMELRALGALEVAAAHQLAGCNRRDALTTP
jgi:hypothetical protein